MALPQHGDDARPRQLALVIHALSGGGAERVLAEMANHWAGCGVHITLITLAAQDADTYPTDDSVQRIYLNAMRESSGALAAIRNNLQRIVALRRALRRARPDFVISFTDQINVLTLVATLGTRLRVIVCDRVDPRQHPLGRAWTWLRRRFYRRCFAAVVQTTNVRDFIQPLVGRRPVYVIPNAVSPEAASLKPATRPTESTADEHKRRRLLAMGRLTRQKGFDLLIDAFTILADQHPNWTLEIFGEGPQRDALLGQIERCRQQDRIQLRGWTDDRLNEISRADLFVLSSRYEGFPNVLLDAMACGLPAVSFDCPSGPSEIIRHNVDGLLAEAENVDSLAAALNQLMSDTARRHAYGGRASDVIDRFSPTLFYSRWQAVWENAATNDPRFAAAEEMGQT